MSRALPLLLLLAGGLAAAPPAAAGPPVWEVAGARNSVYLFGSVHLLRPGDFAIDGALREAYERSGAVFLEVDMDDLSPLDVAAATAARAIDPQGRGLDELMGPSAQAAREGARAAGIDLSLLAGMEPWFAGLAVATLSLAREGYSAAHGVEQLVQERAAADGKQIHGLETLDEQLAALDSLEPELQREFLLMSLTDAGQDGTALEQFLAAWRAGDDDALAEQLSGEFAGNPALYRSLMLERNLRWVERIEDLLEDGQDYLVVVGALHLAGEDGLPALLRARGREVARH